MVDSRHEVEVEVDRGNKMMFYIAVALVVVDIVLDRLARNIGEK